MKFIHAADIHLGNPFIGLDQTLPNGLKKLVQQSTLTAFKDLISSSISEKIDFLVISGDLYNATQNSPQIQESVNQQFERLNRADIAVFLSFGNHDFEANKQSHLAWPKNVHVFEQSVETKYLTLKTGEKIALTGFSYQTQRQTKKVINDFPVKTETTDYHIGLYHGAIGIDGDPYAPFNVGEMLRKNYDYWALGHIHLRQKLNDQPFIGYSGVLQGLNRKEVGEKGYYLVTSKNHVLIPKFHAISPIIWEELILSEVSDELDLINQVLNYKSTKITFLSVKITAQLDNLLNQRLASGTTLEKLREKTPMNLWIVNLTTAHEMLNLLAEDNIDQKYWLESFETVFSNFVISDYVSNQAPTFVRDYFMGEEGKKSLQNKMQQLIQSRKV
ncbi:metallophosphoesterase family protein [Leuconostoc inhae]|uniref:metallophosphoesterase family protein n=1 Tax=Leuconostoc inhae TaxID=178001 RepID=UPI001C7D206E|nr:DNA repair exonuclease [Leuconostoc inhae]